MNTAATAAGDGRGTGTPARRRPLVSIGLPIRNEERFLDATLRALRAQDYPNLEILVSDNASTDGTMAICARHAAEDPRIRIDAQPGNQGALRNFEHVVDMAGGEFFMWAGGHDLWSPGFVTACVAMLEQDARHCLAFGTSRWIGADGEPLPLASGWTDTRGLDPVARMFTVLWGNMHPILGLMRASELRACLPLQRMAGTDLVLLTELVLRGHFVHATDASWSRREFRMERDHAEKVARYRDADTGIVGSRLGRLMPLAELPFALIKVLLRSRLHALDKGLALLALLPSLALRYLVGRRGRPGA